MSNREIFRNDAAIAALQGMLAGGIHTSSLSYDQVAEEAGKYADALAESCFNGDAVRA